MNRRDALTGALLAAVAPSEAVATADPHREWLAEWIALIDEDLSDPDRVDIGSPILVRRRKLEDLIVNTPARTADGMKAKLTILEEDSLRFDEWLDQFPGGASIIAEAKLFLG